jgi:hypothetical protein
MKRTAFHILSVTALTVLLTATSEARQAEATPQPRPRGAAQQAQKDASKAAKQAQQLPRNLAPDQPNQPNPAKRNQQVQRNKVANAVVDHYLGGFQKGVGLDDDQTRKFSPRLGNYVRQQLMLADQRNQAMSRLKELNDQKASEEEIQSQYKILDQTEAADQREKKILRRRQPGAFRSTTDESETIYGQHGTECPAGHPEVPQRLALIVLRFSPPAESEYPSNWFAWVR